MSEMGKDLQETFAYRKENKTSNICISVKLTFKERIRLDSNQKIYGLWATFVVTYGELSNYKRYIQMCYSFWISFLKRNRNAVVKTKMC